MSDPTSKELIKLLQLHAEDAHDNGLTGSARTCKAAAAEIQRLQAVSAELLDILEECESFVHRHSESWYRSGQDLLTRIRAIQARLAPTKEAVGWKPPANFEPRWKGGTISEKCPKCGRHDPECTGSPCHYRPAQGE